MNDKFYFSYRTVPILLLSNISTYSIWRQYIESKHKCFSSLHKVSLKYLEFISELIQKLKVALLELCQDSQG